MRNRQSGFTIIELIVVIALLGILSAVALPRFINVTAEAHDAAVEGAGAGFATGIALLKAQTVANGDLGTATGVDFDGSSMQVNASGFAVGASGAALSVTAASCFDIWTGILQGTGPVVSTTSGANIDYLVTAADPDCTYTYQNDSGQTIVYESDTGNVTTTL
ncbi:type II secretion system protein [Motiliproteus sp. MSK22-1]|uniref:type II secretion system protein n=1 Tax=Motiliproteus sp. MSK22-1 TaxID=1897630 RepID=UPI000977AA1F|nr:prepilin-type N-terminal cleavage/methylation domain-containing protein [Motiliproteus sp. MSK22-1]OMH39595.1 hypothetical protein BGP75_02785 [Motiliproteus sp. MSK22-1]